jgi:uncharacterized membrane protein
MQESTPNNSSQNDSSSENQNPQSLDPVNPGLVVCPDCSAQMPAAATFCPGCGQAMQPRLRAQGSVGLLPENIAGALAYLTFIPAFLFLALEPYKRNRFVRFHAGQCLLLWAGAAVAAALIRLAAIFLFAIPVAGQLLVWLILAVAGLAVVVMWFVLVVKALQGETYKLPVLGDFAERNASQA